MERNIRTHITVNYTNTQENWAVSITLETQIILTTHTFDICYLIFLFLFVIFKKSFLGHNRDNRMRCEHMFFWNKRNISMYIKIASCLISSVVVKSSCPYLSGRCSSGIYIYMLLSEIFKQDKCNHTCNIKKVVKESFPPFICFTQSVIYYEQYSWHQKTNKTIKFFRVEGRFPGPNSVSTQHAYQARGNKQFTWRRNLPMSARVLQSLM